MKRIIPSLLLLVGLSIPLHADEAADLEKQVELIDEAAGEAKPAEVPLEEVARKTKVPEKQLREQQTKTKLGAGSLYIANTLAARTGKSFDEIVAAKNSGKGWGMIARENGVKLGPLVKEARSLEKDQKQAVKQKANKAGKKAEVATTEGKPKPASTEDKTKGKDNPGGGKKK